MLEGKTILITGAASGLGKAWSEGFLEEGAQVIAADIDEEGLAPLAERGAVCVRCDVANEAAVEATVNVALQRSGRLDVLFNNAGIGMNRPFLSVPKDEFEHHVAVHLHGTVYGMRYALRAMARQGSGRIINTISRAAEFAGAKNAAYAAAKAGVWAATRSIAREFEGRDVLINMLIPGPTNTAIWGREMPHLQQPEVTFPTARMLATLPKGGPHGCVYWDEAPYPIFKSLYDTDAFEP